MLRAATRHDVTEAACDTDDTQRDNTVVECTVRRPTKRTTTVNVLKV
jgi:hypothetical protein